jgi:hypothetical protein
VRRKGREIERWEIDGRNGAREKEGTPTMFIYHPFSRERKRDRDRKGERERKRMI